MLLKRVNQYIDTFYNRKILIEREVNLLNYCENFIYGFK